MIEDRDVLELTIELSQCSKCSSRDWKIYTNDNFSQKNNGCFHCKEGKLIIIKKFKEFK